MTLVGRLHGLIEGGTGNAASASGWKNAGTGEHGHGRQCPDGQVANGWAGADIGSQHIHHLGELAAAQANSHWQWLQRVGQSGAAGGAEK